MSVFQRRKKNRTTRLALEALEDKSLLATTSIVPVPNGVLLDLHRPPGRLKTIDVTAFGHLSVTATTDRNFDGVREIVGHATTFGGQLSLRVSGVPARNAPDVTLTAEGRGSIALRALKFRGQDGITRERRRGVFQGHEVAIVSPPPSLPPSVPTPNPPLPPPITLRADLGLLFSGPSVVEEDAAFIQYAAEVTDLGPDTAEESILTVETLGFALDTQRSPGWSLDAQGNYVFALGDVQFGEDPRTIPITFTTPDVDVPTSYALTARVHSPETEDPNAGNNVVALMTEVRPFTVPTDRQLSIAVRTGPSTDTVVKGEEGLSGLRFVAVAQEDTRLTGIILEAREGNLLNGQNFTLKVDADGDGEPETDLQTGGFAQNQAVILDNWVGGGFVVPAGVQVTFGVEFDVARSLTTNSLSLGFEDDVLGFIEAEDAATGASIFDIGFTDAASTVFHLLDQGSLTVVQDSTPTRSHDVLGGMLSEALLRLQFTGYEETIDVTDVQLLAVGESRSIAHFELYVEGATTPFAVATPGGCGTDNAPTSFEGEMALCFCASMENQQLLIPEGQNKDVIIRARMKTDVEGAVSGDRFKVVLSGTPVLNEAAGEGSARGRGLLSFGQLHASNQDGDLLDGEVIIGNTTGAANSHVVGNDNRTVLSDFTEFISANPDANNSNVPLGPSRPFFQVRITAAPHANTQNGLNKLVLAYLTIRVDANNVLMDSGDFRFYDKADSSSKSDEYVVRDEAGNVLTGEVTGTFYVTFSGLAESLVNTQIDPGERSTFVLEGDILNPKIVSNQTSTLQGALLLDTTFGWLDKDTQSTPFAGVDYPEMEVRSTFYVS